MNLTDKRFTNRHTSKTHQNMVIDELEKKYTVFEPKFKRLLNGKIVVSKHRVAYCKTTGEWCSKTIDYGYNINGLRIFGFCKFTQNEGGNQHNQANETRFNIQQAQKFIQDPDNPKNVCFEFICDGQGFQKERIVSIFDGSTLISVGDSTQSFLRTLKNLYSCDRIRIRNFDQLSGEASEPEAVRYNYW